MPLDIVRRGDNYIEIVTYQTQLDDLRSDGFRTETVIYDLTRHFQKRLDKTKDMGGYKTLSEINAYLDLIIIDHPDIVSAKQSLGLTIEGRPIWAVKISDNPELDEDEPEILYTACIHAREVITPEVLFYFMDYLTDNYGADPEATFLVDNREMWFVLVVNPDGYYWNEVIEPNGGGMWRKNRRDNGDGTHGVDLNRNFGYEWGYDDNGSSPYTGDPTYRGTGPFSEPETQVMRDFTISRDFSITVYYHSHGNIVLYPWGYETIYTDDHAIFTAMGDSVEIMNNYEPGTAWELLYPVNGSTDDWGYGEQTLKNKNFAITLEVGNYDDNFWPPLYRIPQLIQENLEPNKFLAGLAGEVYQLLPPEKPNLIVDDSVNRYDYSIAWTHQDTLNPAVAFELIELQNYLHGVIDSLHDEDLWVSDGFTLIGTRPHSGPYSYYSGEDDNLNHHVTTLNPVRVVAGDTLRFWTWYDIETDWDYAYVEISTDGVVFIPIAGSITTEYDPHGHNLGYGITGNSGGWVEALFDLSDYYGKLIYIRFSYKTDEYVTDEGFYVDDISPLDTYEIENIISSSLTDTSYSFINHDSGDFYYKVRARDGESQWSLYSAIKKVTAINLYMCGDVNGDVSINILDISYLIYYLYNGGPAPDPMVAGDVDGSGEINILDISYLINYLYMGGPAPDCP
jgi:hypothetical protein